MQSQIDAFHSALARAPEERASFLRETFPEDPALVLRVLRLIDAHLEAEKSSIESQAEENSRAVRSVTLMPEWVGPYRVRDRIGEGGMGVVYSAEQSEPLRREVAIKVVKLGMDTEEVLSRFEAERHAMAMMDHPGVAKVLDAGATAEGRPYFVMELVSGTSLTEYCRSEVPSLRKKLRLFVQVCEAVHHAHQRGIIHRDLKPSNILVADRDGEPRPKIIDFGISKATATQLTEETFSTIHGRLVGTLEYMSPEQAGLTEEDVDTRSDVFALGVILYELITGVLPIEKDVLRSEGLQEFMVRLREVTPQRPSTRIASRAELAKEHSRPSAATARAVRGELDWIVMRAMEKDRARRYSSAAGLQDDVERFLSDRPVEARPPKASYIAMKFVKRHRFVAALTGLAALSAVVGIVGLTLGLVRANRAEALANYRADNAQAGAAFLEKVLFQADPEIGSDSLKVIDVLAGAEVWIEDELGSYPEVEASVRESIGVAFRRKSLYAEARPHLVRSLELRREQLGNSHLETASSAVALADLRFEHEGSIDGALSLLAEARDVFNSHGLGESTASAWLDLDVGLIALAGDDVAGAEEALWSCHGLLSDDRGADHPDVSRPLRALAAAAAARGDLATAERLGREAIACCSKEDSLYLRARAELVLSGILVEQGKMEEASGYLDGIDEWLYWTTGQRHIRVAERHAILARLHLGSAQFETANVAAERCEALRSELLEEGHWGLLEARLLKAHALIGMGDLDAAASLIEQTARAPGPHLVDDHWLMIDLTRVQLELATSRQAEGPKKALEKKLDGLLASRSRRLRGALSPSKK